MSASRIPLVAPQELKQSWRNRSQQVDAAGLENALRQVVTGEVRFDAGSKHSMRPMARTIGKFPSA